MTEKELLPVEQVADAARIAKVVCGECRLHASNFYGNSKNGYVVAEYANFCCADVEIDLPASWSNTTSMYPLVERYCPTWRPLETVAQ